MIIGVDLSSHSQPNQTPHLFTEAINAAKVAATNSEYAIAMQAVVEILQEYDR